MFCTLPVMREKKFEELCEYLNPKKRQKGIENVLSFTEDKDSILHILTVKYPCIHTQKRHLSLSQFALQEPSF
jgi:hypothetical protein